MTPSASAPTLRMPSIAVTVDGTELAKKWSSRLREMAVQRGVRTVGRATVDISLENLSDLASVPFGLHQKVSLKSSSTVLFQGRIASIEVRNDSRAGTVVHVVAHDDAAALLRTSAVATAENVTFTDIVKKLLQEAGATVGTIDQLSATSFPYVMTSDTALGVIDEIATRTGADWIVRDGKFSMWDASGGTVAPEASVTLGELSTFSLNQDAAALTSVTVRGWDSKNKQPAEGQATAATSRGPAVFSRAEDAEVSRQVASMTVSDTEEAGAVAKALVGTAGRLLARGRGALNPEIEPGAELSLKEAGEEMTGTYYVREVEHRWTSTGSTTAFVAGDRDAPTLADPWSATRSTSLRHTGLYVGIVTQVGSEAEYAGMVRVKFPSLPGAKTDVQSGWARVVMTGAGNQRGLYWLPEVNDEVIVAFSDGDVRRPVVLGALHNGQDAVPEFTDPAVNSSGKVAVRGLVSRLGHSFLLGDGDADADQFVSLGLKGDTELLRLGKDRGDLKVPSGTPFTITVGSSKIDFDGNGGISIEGTTIVLKATQKLELSAPEVSVKGSAKVEVTSSGQLAVKGSVTNVESSGPLALKGAVVAIN